MKRIIYLFFISLVALAPANVIAMNNPQFWANVNARNQCVICNEVEENSNELARLHWNCETRMHPDCLQNWIRGAINERVLGRLLCPNLHCYNRQLTPAQIRRHLYLHFPNYDEQNQLNNRFNQLVEQHEIQQRIANDPVNGRHCPTPNCNHAFLYDGNLASMECPECHQGYCANCLAPHQIGAQCRARENNAEVIKNLENMHQCPRCQRGIEKNQGCDHMVCRREFGGCGHEFCWICLGDYYHYRHDSAEAEQRCRQLLLNRNQTPNVIFGNRNFGARNNPIKKQTNLLSFRTKVTLSIIAIYGIGYGVYRLVKYLRTPKIAPEKDIKMNLEALHTQAINARKSSQSETYIRDSFKNYFLNEEKNNAYKQLNEENRAELRRIVQAFEEGCITGESDKPYQQLVIFIQSITTKKIDADSGQKPVEANQPKAKQVVKKPINTKVKTSKIKRSK